MSLRHSLVETRRSRVTGGRAVVVALFVVLAGCSGTLVELRAAPAEVPDAALAPHEYVHGNTTAVPLTYRVGPPGVSQAVTAETWVSGYSRTTDENQTAILLLYSSPDVRVAGQSVNPLRQLSNRELVGYVLERVTDLRTVGGVENVTDLDEVGARNVTILGTETELVHYTGVLTVDGDRTGAIVSVAVVDHEGDVVVAVGIHEDTLDETATQATLLEQVVHERLTDGE